MIRSHNFRTNKKSGRLCGCNIFLIIHQSSISKLNSFTKRHVQMTIQYERLWYQSSVVHLARPKLSLVFSCLCSSYLNFSKLHIDLIPVGYPSQFTNAYFPNSNKEKMNLQKLLQCVSICHSTSGFLNFDWNFDVRK